MSVFTIAAGIVLGAACLGLMAACVVLVLGLIAILTAKGDFPPVEDG